MLTIQTQWQYKGIQLEVNNKPSATQPDQTMSIREILHRYARGLSITGMPVDDFDEEDDDDLLEDRHEFTKMDKVDRIEYMRAHAEKIESLKKAAEGRQKAKVGRKAPLSPTEAPSVPSTGSAVEGEGASGNENLAPPATKGTSNSSAQRTP